MTIYIVHYNDAENYAAYTSEAKAKQTIWENYCEEMPDKTKTLYGEEDRNSLEEFGYILDYGWIEQVTLYDENGKEFVCDTL